MGDGLSRWGAAAADLRLYRAPTAATWVRLLAAGLLAAGCAPDRPARVGGGGDGANEAAWSRLGLLEGPCADGVRATLAEWRAGGGAIPAPPTPTGERVLRIPTDESGIWVVAEGDGRVLHRVDPSGTWSRSFSEGCVAVDRRGPATAAGGIATSYPMAASAGATAFTDADLRVALAGAGQGGLVVYAWSPHMPLSVDGWAEIAAAARARGMDALPVLIAHGDPDFARREAARGGIPADGTREVASVELIMRDLQVHAPSILVFRTDRVSPVLPGYRNAQGYGRFLDAFVAGG